MPPCDCFGVDMLVNRLTLSLVVPTFPTYPWVGRYIVGARGSAHDTVQREGKICSGLDPLQVVSPVFIYITWISVPVPVIQA